MMMRTSRALVLCALVACGGSSGDFGDNATLVIEPAMSEHIILNGVLPTQGFTAFLVDGNNKKDVTNETVFSIDSGFGAFANATLTIHGAGKSTVSALYVDKTGSAQVISRVKGSRIVDDPANPNDDVPPNAPDLFGSATENPARAPLIVYPADGITMPRNIGDFETHWTDPMNNVFEVSLQSEFTDIKVYVAGNNGVGGGPRPSWFAFTPQEWGFAAATESTVKYQVRGLNSALPSSVGSSPIRLVKLTNEPMEGGVYYWAAAGADYGVFRHDVSKAGQAAEPFMTYSTTSGMCVACHALSRDGKTMAITYDGGYGRATVADVASKTAQPVPALIAGAPDLDSAAANDTTRWSFATLYPDGSKMITVFKGVINVRSTADQSVLATMPGGGFATHPDLSADMTKLVYVRAAGGADFSFANGTIYTRTFDPNTLAFGPEVPLVTDGGHNFYPSFSPDGKWVLFNRGAAGSDAYNNVNASLWIVKADGSGQPIQLSAFNAAAGGITNSWGRWAPFQQTVGANNEQIFWVTVSSKRDFGVRRINTGQAENVKTPQIWMSPFFVSKAEAGMDPTTPAFRLPFQNLASNNHIAQWTERVVDVQ